MAKKDEGLGILEEGDDDESKGKYPCLVEGCEKVFPTKSGRMGHIRIVHNIEAPKRDALELGFAQALVNEEYKGVRKTSTPQVSESEAVDIGQKSQLKGELRLMMKRISQMKPDVRDELMPEREMISDFIKRLTKVRVDAEEMADIESKYLNEIRPAVEDRLGGADTTPEAGVRTKVPMTESMRVATVKGAIRTLMKRIGGLPANIRDELTTEKEALGVIVRRISQGYIPPAEMAEIEALVLDDLKPYVDSIIDGAPAATPKPADVQKPKSVLEEMNDKEMKAQAQEYERIQMETRLAQARRDREAVLNASVVGSQGHQSIQYTRRPMIDISTGRPMRDPDTGHLLFEEVPTVMGGVQSVDPLLLALVTKENKSEDNTTSAIVTGLLGALTEAIKPRGVDPTVAVLTTKLESIERRLESGGSDTKRGEDWSLLREELREQRRSSDDLRVQLHSEQLDRMREENDDLKRLAFQDPFERVLGQKKKLVELGLVNDGKSDAESQALTQSVALAQTAINKVDGLTASMETIVKPLADAQGAYLKAQAEGGAKSRTMTTEERDERYRNMLNAIDHMG